MSTTIGSSAFAVNSALGMTTENVAGTFSYYVRDPAGNLISVRTPSGTFYYVTDEGGSVSKIVDSGGTVVAAYEYDSWGQTTAMSGGAIAINNPWRYRSGYQDGTGLYQFGARFYDPTLGRWTQQDPMYNPLDPTQSNRYAYVADDPVNSTDLNGLGFLSGLVCFAKNNWKTIGGIALGVTGIIVTGGAATPLVTGLGLASSIGGTALSAWGANEALEKGDDVGFAFGLLGSIVSGYGIPLAALGLYGGELAPVIKGTAYIVGGLSTGVSAASVIPAAKSQNKDDC